jgi:hypothetical protein
MQDAGLRHGDVVEVMSPAEILATLDERGMHEGLPFMPEMLKSCGHRFVVDRQASKICDTIGDLTSRSLPGTVLLEDLRCDGSAHDGCQAECRLFWKDAWLRRVASTKSLPVSPSDEGRSELVQLLISNTTRPVDSAEQVSPKYVCQATELVRASERLSTWDPAPYLREYTLGHVGLGRFLRVMARAAVQQTLNKLGLRPVTPLRGTRSRGVREPDLNLQPGELVRVKSKHELATVLTPDGKNRGLWFDREMLPFCGRTFAVRQRLSRFIEDRTGHMIELKTRSVTLESVVCSGERSVSRWFCSREIYPYWREAWLERVEGAVSDPDQPATSVGEVEAAGSRPV